MSTEKKESVATKSTKGIKDSLSSFAGAFLDFARALDCFVDFRIAFVGNCRRTLDGYVELIGNVEINAPGASGINDAARRVEFERVDLSGPVLANIDHLRVPRNNDIRRAVRIDLKLVVVQVLDLDVSCAVDRKTFEIGN